MTDKKQPEALRLANALEYCDASVARQAINELRRLHAEHVALRASHGQAPAPMSPANRLVAYSAATRLRELGFEWDATAEAWLQPAPSAQAADSVLEDAFKLLDEVAQCFTTDDGLPDNLLPRIDAVIAARAAQEGKTP